MIIEKLKLDPLNYGLLAIFFPGVPILQYPLPLFIPDPKVIVVSEREMEFYPDKEVIQITLKASLKLDSKEGAIAYLRKDGIKISEGQEGDMMLLEDSTFWEIIKCSHVTRTLNFASGDEKSSVFKMFITLFQGFEGTYRIYRSLGQPHRMVFSALLTMMLKAQVADTLTVNPGYKRILLSNREHMAEFKKAVLEYVDSGMKEIDFIAFLHDLSNSKRAS